MKKLIIEFDKFLLREGLQLLYQGKALQLHVLGRAHASWPAHVEKAFAVLKKALGYE